MPSRLLRDPIYLGNTVLMAGVAVGFAVLRPWLEGDLVRVRPLSAILAVVLALGLHMRARGGMRVPTVVVGLLVVVACGAQLARFILTGAPATPPPGELLVGPSFAAGMLCLGMALVIDGMLPKHWGRHLVFGLIGAVVAGLAVFGLLGFAGLGRDAGMADLSLPIGMTLPSALILLFGGIALLAGTRLRGAPMESAGLVDTHSTAVRDRTGLVAGLAMLVIALGATAIVWRMAVTQAAARERDAAESALSRFATALSAQAIGPAVLLDGVGGLFAASSQVTTLEWSDYLRNVTHDRRFDSVIALLYTRELKPAAGSGAIPVLTLEGVDHPIRPPGRRERYVVIVHVSPDTAFMRALIGMDIAAEDRFREFIDMTRGRSSVVVSPPLEIAGSTSRPARKGFALVRAVDARADDAPGFVHAVIDMSVIVAQANRDTGDLLQAIRVSDVTPGRAQAPLFGDASGDASSEAPGVAVSTRLDVGGRAWQVDASVLDAAAGASVSRMTLLVLVGGSIVALVLFAITWVLAGHRARALNLASRMTAELRRSQRAQQAITDTANAGIITTDALGVILYMNPAASAIFGVDPATSRGRSLIELVPERHRDRHLLGIERAREGQPRNIIGHAIETTGLRSDGSEVPLELLASSWTSDGEVYFTGFVRDISERKRQHLMLEQKTRELERSNADLEQFAYVASHDLQEPLRMVASYVQLLSRRYRGKLDADADEFIGFAVDGATRMQRLIQDLLAYARVGRSGRQPIVTHVGHCADEAIAQLQEAIVENDARVRVDADVEAMAVPSQLTQLFQNLIGNALKFRGQAAPRIDIDAVRDGGFCRVRVRDNGIGIEPQHRERVFAIFQRLHTRREYPGTGIGLAICRKIAEGLGGRIWVESEPGQGSVFLFTLPVIEEHP